MTETETCAATGGVIEDLTFATAADVESSSSLTQRPAVQTECEMESGRGPEFEAAELI